MTAKDLIDAEAELAALWNAGEINALTHFAGGNEQQLLDIFADIQPDDWVLVSHRAHYHARLHGMSREELRAEVLAGRSMFTYGPRFIQSAICAGLCSTAVGLALAIQRRMESRKVVCFLGDGAAAQGCFFEAVNMAIGRDLPVKFIIESNNRQCGVSMEDRFEKPFPWPSSHVMRYEYTPTYPHAGTTTRPALKSQEAPEWLTYI